MQKNWSETLVMIAEIEGRGLHDSPYRSFLQCLSPTFRGKKENLEIAGCGSFPANEKWGEFEICFEILDLWGTSAAEVLLDLEQD